MQYIGETFQFVQRCL